MVWCVGQNIYTGVYAWVRVFAIPATNHLMLLQYCPTVRNHRHEESVRSCRFVTLSCSDITHQHAMHRKSRNEAAVVPFFQARTESCEKTLSGYIRALQDAVVYETFDASSQKIMDSFPTLPARDDYQEMYDTAPFR